MRMIPDVPHGTNSVAEKRIFDRLRAAFMDEPEDSFIAFHSLNLPQHAYKRFGEVDFLICCPYGLFALEIKGGRVSCCNGLWQFMNRYGESNKSVEGPFRQVESALHALINKLETHFNKNFIDQFSIGYGVICPDCELTLIGAEWDSSTLAGARSSRNIEDWLKTLFSYWRKKDGGLRHASPDSVKEISRFLRPDFEAVIPLHILAYQASERIDRLTEDQISLVDIVIENPRVLCFGGAGTGKTFMAMELARRWTSEGMNVALVCRSPWLKAYLESRFSISRLTVSVIDSIKINCIRQGLSHFDALIIDEGQDLFDMDSIRKLNEILLHGLDDGRWCLFYDKNNQSGLIGVNDQSAIDYLNSLKAAKIPLNTNCRNTLTILEMIKTTLGADMGTKGAGIGPDVREKYVTSTSESVDVLIKELNEIIYQGGISPGEVTILSPYPFQDSCVSEIPEKIRESIVVLDEYSLRNFPVNKVSFSEIKNFKGLENEVIIVVDISLDDKNQWDAANHYVAMSRAKTVLSLILIKRNENQMLQISEYT